MTTRSPIERENVLLEKVTPLTSRDKLYDSHVHIGRMRMHAH